MKDLQLLSLSSWAISFPGQKVTPLNPLFSMWWSLTSAEPGVPSAENFDFALCSGSAFSPAGELCQHPLGGWGGGLVLLGTLKRLVLLLLVSHLSALFQEGLVALIPEPRGVLTCYFSPSPLPSVPLFSVPLRQPALFCLFPLSRSFVTVVLLSSLSVWVHALKKNKNKSVLPLSGLTNADHVCSFHHL